MLRKIDIVEVLVRDWPAAVRWYTETLCLKLIFQNGDDRWAMLSFADGGPTLALFGSDGVEPGGASRCLPDILVDDLDAAMAELKAKGVEFRGEVRDGEGYRITTLVDPEGNELQIYERR